MSQTTLSAKLARIAELRAEIAKVDPLKQELDELKFELQLEMQQSQSKRTEAYGGVYAVRAVRTNIRVADELALTAWLEDTMFDTTAYYKLDEPKIKALAEAKLKEDGEIVPGLEAVETEYVSIKEVKEK